jgi:hypothetical protein
MAREHENTRHASERAPEGAADRSVRGEQMSEIIRALWSINDALRALGANTRRPSTIPGVSPSSTTPTTIHNHYLRDNK